MDEIIEIIDKEIERLNAARALLAVPHYKRGIGPERPKRTMSPKARKAIATAQKKRWADYKKVQPIKA